MLKHPFTFLTAKLMYKRNQFKQWGLRAVIKVILGVSDKNLREPLRENTAFVPMSVLELFLWLVFVDIKLPQLVSLLSTGTVGLIDQWLPKMSCKLSLAARIGGSAEEEESKVIPENRTKGCWMWSQATINYNQTSGSHGIKTIQVSSKTKQLTKS